MCLDGIDPAKAKRQAKAQLSNTFGAIAKEWLDTKSVQWKPTHAVKVWNRISDDLLPYLENEPIDKISTTDLLEVLRKVEKRGALDVASRLRQQSEAIFKHAILTDRADTNPATQLVGVLKTKKVQHLKALDHKELPEFFSRLETYEKSHVIVKTAVKIIAHTFIRTNELRFTPWSEIDFDERMWLIPAARMKMDADHFVPLTEPVIKLFRDLQQYNGDKEFVFASPQRPRQAISQNAMIQLIYRMGYKNKATVHGFRTTASTYLNESGYNPDAIERQLSHTERNQVRAAYNRSEYLEERKRLLHDWSQYLDSLSNRVVPIKTVKIFR